MAMLDESPGLAVANRRQGWPGPRGNWLTGCLRQIRKNELEFYRNTWRTSGDYVRIPTLPGYDVYLVADPASAGHGAISALVRHRMNNPLPAPLWVPPRRNRAFSRSKAALDRVVLRVIESRRRHGATQRDLLDLLLAARDEDSGTGMSD